MNIPEKLIATREPMSFLEAHAKSFGEFHYEGKHYVLISLPYSYMAKDETPHYNADAVLEGDTGDEEGFLPVYQVRWPMTDENQIAYCQAVVERNREKAMAIMQEYGVNEDTVIISDWDQPYAVNLTMYKYRPETCSKRYQWD